MSGRVVVRKGPEGEPVPQWVPSPSDEEIEETYRYHAPTDRAKAHHGGVEAATVACAKRLRDLVPGSEGLTEALRLLRAVRMAANEGIALNHAGLETEANQRADCGLQAAHTDHAGEILLAARALTTGKKSLEDLEVGLQVLSIHLANFDRERTQARGSGVKACV